MDPKETGQEGMDWIHLAQDRGPMVGSCEHGNEPSDFMKGREFLNQVNDYYLLKKDSAPQSQLLNNVLLNNSCWSLTKKGNMKEIWCQ